MSGGHFDYIDQRAKNEIFGYFGEEKEKIPYVECVMSGVPESEIVRLQKGTAKNAD